jgi:dTDP-4-amino-4,6-dideoxygalactose transaminase
MDFICSRCESGKWMISCINPKENYQFHKAEIDQAIIKVCESGKYILGEEVNNFEYEFCKYVGTKYAVGVASGTDAIFLSLKSLNIGSFDEVITTSHTATATISAIEATGAKAVFVDIEEDYFSIDASLIEDVITPNTKAIVPVHIYGQPCDMEKLQEISKKYNLHLVEDCAQASGAKYKSKGIGGIGIVGCFSFFPTKNLGALGDGGAITTNSKEIYNKLLMLRQYGWNEKRESKFQGFNSRLDEIQAAILRVKLKYLSEHISKRNEIASIYNKYLKNTSYVLPLARNGCQHAYHLYVIKTKNRDKLIKFLEDKNISAMIHYKKAAHMQKTYKGKSKLPVTEAQINNILSLPMYPELDRKTVIHVCKMLIEFDKKNAK